MPVAKIKTAALALLSLLVCFSLSGCEQGQAERDARATQVAANSPLEARPTAYSADNFAPLGTFDSLSYISPPGVADFLNTGTIVDRQFLDLDGDHAPEALITLAYDNPAGGDPLLNMVVAKYYSNTVPSADLTVTPTPNSSRGIDLYGWAPLWPNYLLNTPTPLPTSGPTDTPLPTYTPRPTDTPKPTATATATPGGPSPTSIPPTATDTPMPTSQFSPTLGPTFTPTPTPTPKPTLTSAQLAAFVAIGQPLPLPLAQQGHPLTGGPAVFGLRYTSGGQYHLKLWAWQRDNASALKFNGQGNTLTSSQPINIVDLQNNGNYVVATSDTAGKLQVWRWNGQQFSPQP